MTFDTFCDKHLYDRKNKYVRLRYEFYILELTPEDFIDIQVPLRNAMFKAVKS